MVRGRGVVWNGEAGSFAVVGGVAAEEFYVEGAAAEEHFVEGIFDVACGQGGIAIAVAKSMRKRLPERALRYTAAAIFIVSGTVTVLTAKTG